MNRTVTSCAAALLLFACSSDSSDESGTDAGSADTGDESDVSGDGGEGTDVAEDIRELLTPEAHAEFLQQRGEWNIGYQIVELTWEPALTDEPREIDVVVWYPTEEEGGTAPFYLGVWPDEESQVDATPLELESMPVMVISHGTQGYPQGASFMGKYFASHGWLVLAPTHSGDTLAPTDPRTTDIYWQRAGDVSTTLDWALGDSNHPWAGRTADFVIGAGHSFGGYTMMTLAGARFDLEWLDEWCAGPDARENFCGDYDAERRAIFAEGLRDERIEAVISLAAGDDDKFGLEGIQAIEIPVLQMSADEDDRTGQNAGPYWEGLGRDGMWWVQLTNAGHLHFIDTCYSQPGVIGCEEDDEDPTVVFDTINVYSHAFVNWVRDGSPIGRAVLDEAAYQTSALSAVIAGD